MWLEHGEFQLSYLKQIRMTLHRDHTGTKVIASGAGATFELVGVREVMLSFEHPQAKCINS
ncbi:hypothetical protein [Silvimonas iriomotensis]|uniref:Uncharacterized protein n=1 Tax=Silvimonas iriomotensis TaxID=449662 RepID=A0ABQ2PCF9_9NEIS|nr:hypothetical protein [Silvimonas iriomotensis]GGP23031.1 hypothetical protein GCM10010970_30310 [Silvimonas iriomotensis]